jgi:hypothetical protein
MTKPTQGDEVINLVFSAMTPEHDVMWMQTV